MPLCTQSCRLTISGHYRLAALSPPTHHYFHAWATRRIQPVHDHGCHSGRDEQHHTCIADQCGGNIHHCTLGAQEHLQLGCASLCSVSRRHTCLADYSSGNIHHDTLGGQEHLCACGGGVCMCVTVCVTVCVGGRGNCVCNRALLLGLGLVCQLVHTHAVAATCVPAAQHAQQQHGMLKLTASQPCLGL